MLKCEIRADNTLHIEGYVNAVERDSRPVMVPSLGRCVEQVRAGVFGAALAENPDVELLENHDHSRKLGSTSDGVLTLSEDSIGLRASADISDPDMITKARTGQLKGWSFGFVATSSEVENRANGIPRRTVTGMKLSEVSLIDGKYTPCYAGTLVEVRAVDDSAEMVEFRADEDIEIIDSSLVDEELRYNPYHDPSNGRFCSGGGSGGGGVLMVEKGQKGKGVYVVPSENFENKRIGNPEQQKTIDRIERKLESDPNTVKMPEYEVDEAGKIWFNYETKKTSVSGRGISNYTEDVYEKVYKREGVIGLDGNIRFRDYGGKKISETLIQKGTSPKKSSSKQNSKPKTSNSSDVTTYVINKGTPSQYFGLKTADGEVLYAPNNWKTEKGALNWAKKNGYTTRSFDPNESIPEELRSLSDEVVEEMDNHNKKEEPVPDYSYYERAMQLLELRYNPYHDPSNGRFCSGGGSGGGGVLFVGKGQKGKGVYVVDVDHDDEYEKWKADKAGGGVKYLSSDNALYESPDEVLYVEREKKNGFSAGGDDVLTAKSDGNGNITLSYATPNDYYQQNSNTSYALYEIKSGITNADNIHGSREFSDKRKTSSKIKSGNEYGSTRSVGIDWSKVKSVTGQTYNVKDLIKSKGFKWDKNKKGWVK